MVSSVANEVIVIMSELASMHVNEQMHTFTFPLLWSSFSEGSSCLLDGHPFLRAFAVDMKQEAVQRMVFCQRWRLCSGRNSLPKGDLPGSFLPHFFRKDCKVFLSHLMFLDETVQLF